MVAVVEQWWGGGRMMMVVTVVAFGCVKVVVYVSLEDIKHNSASY